MMKFQIEPKIKQTKKLPGIVPEDKTGLSYKLRQIIFQAAEEVLGGESQSIKFSDILLEHPEKEEFGDYATNITMILAGRLKKKKRNFLENIKRMLKEVTAENFWEIENPVAVGRVKKNISSLLDVKESLVYCHPRVYAKVRGWMKKFPGHSEIDEKYWLLLPYILSFPQKVLQDPKRSQNKLFVFYLWHTGVLVVETRRKRSKYNEMITIFLTHPKRLEKLRVIWEERGKNKKDLPGGLASPAVLAPDVRRDGGTRFPTLREISSFYSRVQKLCQEDILFYEEKFSSRELAEKIIKCLEAKNLDFLEKIEIAGPGFINISLSKKYLIEKAQEVLEKADDYSKSLTAKGKRIMVEYTDPNPFKEFHIGHLYSNVIGEALSKILEATGAIVWRADFYGDVGMHVAKSVWGMMKKCKVQNAKCKVEERLKELEKRSLTERVKFLGQGYALGVKAYEDDKKAREEIKDLNYLVYVAGQEALKKSKGWQPIVNYQQYIKGKENKLKEVQKVYEAGLKWSLEYFESVYKRLGTKFDGYYPESWTGELGMKLVEKGLAKGVLERSDGAVIYIGEQDGLHTRVFVNKLGLPTYEAKDLGLALAKYQDFKYDLSINVFGKEIDEYYKVVKAALTKIRPELGKRSMHIAHGMVNLPEGKMSSRTGNVITVEWLLSQTKKQVLKIMTDSDLSAKEKQEVAEMVAQAAIKYAFLKSSIGGNIVFDFSSSVTLEGDSGPYLQYTYARCRSVIRKSKLKAQKSKPQLKAQNLQDIENLQPITYNLQPNPEELSLLRTFYRFPEVVLKAASSFSPNIICNFLYDLSQKYNTFYNKCSILKAEEEKKNLRLLLTAACAQILKNGLYLLGIGVLEKM